MTTDKAGLTALAARQALGNLALHNISPWVGRSPLPQWLNDMAARGLMRLVAIDLRNDLTEPRRWKAYPTAYGMEVARALASKEPTDG